MFARYVVDQGATTMTSTSCIVVDYGIGNVFSVLHALQSCGVSATFSGDRDAIMAADRVILPGVGAFGRAADRLRDLGLDETIHNFIRTERPFLGICVGMQLLIETGFEFGEHQGLGLISGTVEKINFADAQGRPVRVPLIGWYPVGPGHATARDAAAILSVAQSEEAYYFVHSFEARLKDEELVLAWVDHGTHRVVAAVRKDNVYGVQFHPERSGQAGLDLLRNFLSA